MEKTYGRSRSSARSRRSLIKYKNIHFGWNYILSITCSQWYTLSLVTAKMKKAIQTYPWSLESLFKWRTRPLFSLIIIMKWMKCILNPQQYSQSFHDCPFPLLNPKIRYVQLVYCRITGKVSIFSHHDCTYCASIRTDNSNRANNSSSALVNNIRRKQINPQFPPCTSLDYITGVVTMVPCGPFGPRMPFGPKSPGGP